MESLDSLLSYLLFLATVFLGFSGYGQIPYTPEFSDPITESWRWTQFSELEGRNIRCQYIENDSIVWFGEDGTLIRYNGYKWKEYDLPSSYKNTPIHSILVEGETVYTGTSHGLFSLNKAEWKKVFPFSDKLRTVVRDLARLPNGMVVAGLHNNSDPNKVDGLLTIMNDRLALHTSSNTIKRLGFKNTNKFTLRPVSDNLLSQPHNNFGISDLFVNKGSIYVAVSRKQSTGKIIVMSAGSEENQLRVMRSYSESDGLKIRGDVHLECTEDGNLWVVSSAHDYSTYVLIDGKWTSYKLSDEFGGIDSQNSLMIAKDGSIWIGDYGRFFVHRNGKWKEYKYLKTPFTPTSRIIFNETEDGKVWILDELNGVHLFDYGFKKWKTLQNLSFQFQTEDQTFWYISKQGEIIVNEQESWYVYARTEGLINFPVKLFLTSYGEVWAIGSDEGQAAISYFDNKEWKKILFPEVSWSFDHRAIYESSDHSIWVGSAADIDLKNQKGGIIRFPNPQDNKKSFLHYTYDENVSIPLFCYGIGESKDSIMWFGGRELTQFNHNTWSSIDSIPAFERHIDYIHTDENKQVWAGSRHSGVFVYDGLKWSNYSKDQGLSANNVISISSHNNSTWVMTFKGLNHFDGFSWTNNVFPVAFESISIGTLSVDLESNYHINHTPASWVRRGLSPSQEIPIEGEFKSISYVPDRIAPQTTISSFSKKVESSGSNVIFWEGKDYMVNTKPQHLQYSWRLNKNEWSPFSLAQYQRFEELEPGDYELEVRSRDHDFNIETQPERVEFIILAPWWSRLEFILLMILVLTIIIWLQYRILSRNKSLAVLNDQLQEKSKILISKNEQIELQKNQLSGTIREIKQLSSSRLKFFTNISHEFRTPLGLILSPLEELIERKLPKSTVDKYYGLMRRNANRILRLINQILEVYKIEMSTLEYHPTNGDLILFLNQIVTLFEPLATKKDVSLKFYSDQDTLITEFDHDKMEKIIFNLLSNALKNVSNKGLVRVEVKAGDDNFVLIKVIDDGKGIPKEHMEKIFDRFFSLDDQESIEAHTATGIGLAYIKDLVKIQQGKISVESDPGKATTFSVSIPNRKSSNETPQTDDSSLSPRIHSALSGLKQTLDLVSDIKVELPSFDLGEVKILIIDDDSDTRTLLKHYLGQNFVIEEADNGDLGIDIARKTNPDLIITDVMMPKRSGYQVCQELKSDLDTSHIPVLLLTAKTTNSDRINSYDAGADGYMEKPVNLKLLLSRITTLISNRKKLKEKFVNAYDTKPLKSTGMSQVDKQFIQKAFNKVKENINDPKLDANKLAREVGVSRIQLYRKIKSLTDQTVSEFIKSIRLKIAAQLLLDDSLSVAEVAYRTGFSTPNNFATYFKKQLKLSPSEYQKKGG